VEVGAVAVQVTGPPFPGRLGVGSGGVGAACGVEQARDFRERVHSGLEPCDLGA
jgi:hypothetical protein